MTRSHFLVDMAHIDFKTIHIPKPETSNHVQPVDGILFTQILSSEEEPVIRFDYGIPKRERIDVRKEWRRYRVLKQALRAAEQL